MTTGKADDVTVAAVERRFKALVEQGAGGVTILDKTGKVVYDAVTAGTLLGFTPGETLGRSFFALVHPEDRSLARTAFRRLLRTPRRPITMELRVRAKAGAFVCLHVTASNRLRDAGIRGVVLNSFDITERKDLEEALRLSESRFRMALAGTPATVFTQDRKLRYTWVYNATPEFRQADVLGKRDSDVLDPGDARRLMAFKRQVLKTGVACRREFFRSVNGIARTFDLVLEPLRDDHGRIIGITGAAFDVTEREQVENTLRRFNATLEQRVRERTHELQTHLDALRRLHQLGTLFVQEAGLQQVLDEVLDAAIAITGGDFGNIQLLDPESSDLKIVAQRGFPKWWCDFWNRVCEGKGVCGTAMANGRRVVVEDVTKSRIFAGTSALKVQLKAGVRAVQSTPLVSRSGKVIGMCSTHYKTPHRPDQRALCLLDLLARHAADTIQHVQMQAALRESEERFRIITTSTPDHLIVQDCDLRYMLVINPQLGLTVQQMVGKRDQDILERSDAEELTRLKRKVLSSGRPLHVEMPATSKTGDLEYFEGEYVPKRNAAGKVDGVIGYFRNVTERKRAEAAIAELNEQLRARAVRLRALAAELTEAEHKERRRIAHLLHEDLQQRLAAMKYKAQSLRHARNDRTVVETADYLTDALDDAIRLTRHLTSSMAPPVLQALGLRASLEWLANDIRRQYGLVVRVTGDRATRLCSDEVHPFACDAVRELLLNVHKHAGVKSAEVRLRAIGKKVISVAVCDNGDGMTDSNERGEHFGLFSIGERAEAMGMRFDIRSRPGQGTCATLTLPTL